MANTPKQADIAHAETMVASERQASIVRRSLGVPIRPGDLIHDRFEVLEILSSETSSSVVAKVTNKTWGQSSRAVVVKLPLVGQTAETSSQQRLDDLTHIETSRDAVIAEAEMLVRLDHPHVIRILWRDSWEGVPYILMEWAPLGDLQHRMIRGQFSIPTALNLIAQIGWGLQHIHDQGLVHRDIKPSNIMIFGNENDIIAKIGDMGIGDFLETASAGQIRTVRGFSLNYAAPEQLEGAFVDQRADVFAFAVLSYELLTGTYPFDCKFLPADTVALNQRLIRGLRPISQQQSEDLGRRANTIALQACFESALAPDPHRRTRSVAQFMDGLDRAIEHESLTDWEICDAYSARWWSKEPLIAARENDPPARSSKKTRALLVWAEVDVHREAKAMVSPAEEARLARLAVLRFGRQAQFEGGRLASVVGRVAVAVFTESGQPNDLAAVRGLRAALAATEQIGAAASALRLQGLLSCTSRMGAHFGTVEFDPKGLGGIVTVFGDAIDRARQMAARCTSGVHATTAALHEVGRRFVLAPGAVGGGAAVLQVWETDVHWGLSRARTHFAPVHGELFKGQISRAIELVSSGGNATSRHNSCRSVIVTSAPLAGRTRFAEALVDSWLASFGVELADAGKSPPQSRCQVLYGKLTEASATGCDEEPFGSTLMPNSRTKNPTAWELMEHLGLNPESNMLLECAATFLALRRSLAARPFPLAERIKYATATATLVAALAAERPLLVVLDDLQRCGEATRKVWSSLHRRTSRFPILLVGTWMDLGKRPGLEVDEQFSLARLSRDETRQLTQRLTQDEGEAASDSVERLTDHFALRPGALSLFVATFLEGQRQSSSMSIDAQFAVALGHVVALELQRIEMANPALADAVICIAATHAAIPDSMVMAGCGAEPHDTDSIGQALVQLGYAIWQHGAFTQGPWLALAPSYCDVARRSILHHLPTRTDAVRNRLVDWLESAERRAEFDIYQLNTTVLIWQILEAGPPSKRGIERSLKAFHAAFADQAYEEAWRYIAEAPARAARLPQTDDVIRLIRDVFLAGARLANYSAETFDVESWFEAARSNSLAQHDDELKAWFNLRLAFHEAEFVDAHNPKRGVEMLRQVHSQVGCLAPSEMHARQIGLLCLMASARATQAEARECATEAEACTLLERLDRLLRDYASRKWLQGVDAAELRLFHQYMGTANIAQGQLLQNQFKRIEEGDKAFERAISLMGQSTNASALASAHLNLANSLFRQERYDDAKNRALEAERQGRFAHGGHRPSRAATAINLAGFELRRANGSATEALAWADEALCRLKGMSNWKYEAQVQTYRSEALLRLGSAHEARLAALEAIHIAEKAGEHGSLLAKEAWAKLRQTCADLST